MRITSILTILITAILSNSPQQAQASEEPAQPQISIEFGPSIGNLTALSLEGKLNYRPDKNKPFSIHLMYSDGMNFVTGYQTLTLGGKYYFFNHPNFQPYLKAEAGVGSRYLFRSQFQPVVALGIGSDFMFNEYVGVGLGLNAISNFSSFNLGSDLTFVIKI